MNARPDIKTSASKTESTAVDVEAILLDLADYVYAQTAIKPMSKVLFLVSRLLLIAKTADLPNTVGQLEAAYDKATSRLGSARPDDDYEFETVAAECATHLPYITDAVQRVCSLASHSDTLGLAFDTLLRGKFEAGEGLGTFLTPEEVVRPMVTMLVSTLPARVRKSIGQKSGTLFGDICGGTGRFVYALARQLQENHAIRNPDCAARLFDQSSFAVDCARLNFLFDEMQPNFARVGDSLLAPEVSELKGRFSLLATNSPFGTGKYQWHPELADVFPKPLLAAIGMTESGDRTDPALLFLFRNLQLLAPGGCLAIVLPDGVIHSATLANALRAYEAETKSRIEIAAIVSLPTVTFALGGTVAKTSFLIARSVGRGKPRGMYVASAGHVGFLKRGNRRLDDPQGNDLDQIAADFIAGKSERGRRDDSWRTYKSLAPADRSVATVSAASIPLADLAQSVRTTCTTPADFHVSILNVEETGLIDIVATTQNQPTTPGLECQSGDVLVSCINPRIWRVTVIPKIAGTWSCSPEFAVLRPHDLKLAWAIGLALHHTDPMTAIREMAGGTSSSRQRVPRDRVISISVPRVEVTPAVRQHARQRTKLYQTRLMDAALYGRLHSGDMTVVDEVT